MTNFKWNFNFIRNISTLFVLSLFLLLSSCVQTLNSTRLPRESFIFLDVVSSFIICSDDNEENSECLNTMTRSHASGALIASNRIKNSSYILTAAHVCTDDMENTEPLLREVGSILKIIKAKSLEDNTFLGNVIALDKKSDLCLIKTEFIDHKPLRLESKRAKPGERLFNISAPRGVWEKDSVLIFEGILAGKQPEEKGRDDIYSIPAAPGSSGSPVLNSHGHLVGMIHSVLGKFNNVSFGTGVDKILDFSVPVLKKEGIVLRTHNMP